MDTIGKVLYREGTTTGLINVVDIKNDLARFKDAVCTVPDITWYVGKQLNEDKTDMIDSTAYSVSDYIDVNNFERLNADLGVLGIYINGFNSNHAYIGAKGWFYEDSNYIDISNYAYIRITIRNKAGSGKGSPSEEEIAEAHFLLVTNIESALKRISDEIEDAVEKQAENTEAVKAVISEIAGISTTTELGALQSDGSIQPGSEIFLPETTDFIPIAYGETITAKARYRSSTGRLWGAFCFYDTDHKLVGGRNVRDSMTGDTLTLTIKNNHEYAKYVRITWRTNIGTAETPVQLQSCEIYVSNLNDCVSELSDRISSGGKEAISDYHMLPIICYQKRPLYCFAKGKMWEEHWNTAEAYIAAGKDPNCSTISADVQLTSDGELVMYHDKAIEAGTDGTGILNNMTYAQLQAVNVDRGVWNGSTWTGKADSSTAKIPKFEDFLDICKGYSKMFVLEFKGNTTSGAANRESFGDENLHRVAQMILDRGLQHSVIIYALDSIRTFFGTYYPEFMLTASFEKSYSEIETWTAENMKYKNMVVYVPVDNFTDQIGDYFHRHGFLVCVSAKRPQTDQQVIDAVNNGCNMVAVNQPIPTALM